MSSDRTYMKPTLLAMMKAINDKTRLNDPDYRYLLGTEILLEYIYDWAGGGRTDNELLDLLVISIRNTQDDIDNKKEVQP